MYTERVRDRYFSFFWMLLLVLASTASHARALPDFTQLVIDNSPSVVNISTKQHRPQIRQLGKDFQIPNLPEDSPLNDLFRRFLGEGFGQLEPREHDAQSLGSGFVISKDGYILTNYHVVNGADEILVRLNSHHEYMAEVIGMDKASDVALLKIDAKGLPMVKVGSSSDLKVGAWVLAIGSPFGFDHSVTAGIVSAKGRSLPSENYVPFIQTDVAINPGNSGGPLFNMKGEVVGINSQIYSRTGGFMGLSFAIPIEMAMNVADQLRDQGRVSRGWLGVQIQDVTRELADSFGMKQPRGALVARVFADSPAEKAGIEAGDIILQFNGKHLHDSTMLPPLVGSSRVNKPAKILILRSGKRKTISVEIGELPADDKIELAAKEVKKSVGNLLGLVVRDITRQLLRQFKLDAKHGVLVETVKSGPAKAAGIRQGDIIQMINNRRVRNLEEFEAQLARLPKGEYINVLVMRRSGPIFLALQVPGE
ncbi:MAG: DegQ family serine endoprotease [Candidatus Sedimenticola sp. (ex Thyasira tokunagai)]